MAPERTATTKSRKASKPKTAAAAAKATPKPKPTAAAPRRRTNNTTTTGTNDVAGDLPATTAAGLNANRPADTPINSQNNMTHPGQVPTAPGTVTANGGLAAGVPAHIMAPMGAEGGSGVPAPSTSSGQAMPEVDVNVLLKEIQDLKQQLEAVAQPVPAANDDEIPKPPGQYGGGQKGFHLQEEMGLGGEEGRKKYLMILATVRDLAHAARLDVSKKYTKINAEDLVKIFVSARNIHPYLAKFENNWATSEVLKQYLSSARRYGRRMGYFEESN